MADDETETPDAVVELHVDTSDDDGGDDGGGDTTVIVVDGADDGHEVEQAVDVEHRLTELEARVRDLESREYVYVTHEEVADIVDDAVVDAAVVADIVAEETAEEVAEVVAEETAVEVVEDVSPHKTHWLFRDWGEWTGKNGSGRVDVK